MLATNAACYCIILLRLTWQACSQNFQKGGDKIGGLLLRSGGRLPTENLRQETQVTHITCESMTLTETMTHAPAQPVSEHVL